MVIASRVAILGFGCVLSGAFAVDAQVTSVDFAGRLATSGRFFATPSGVNCGLLGPSSLVSRPTNSPHRHSFFP